MILKCEKCGGKLKLENNRCICVDCGNVYNFLAEDEKEVLNVETTKIENFDISTEEVIETNIENNLKEEKTDKPKKKTNWKGWILGLSLVALLMYAFIWMSGSDERTIKEVLADNGYSDLEIVAVENLGGNIEGLVGNYKMVLIKRPSGELKYGFGAVNVKDRTFQNFEFGYTPLNALMLKVFSSGEQMNIDNFNKAIDYVKKYGYYCLSNQDHAENYIREMTGENGFLPCEIGRKAIKDNITYILPNISSLPQSDVIFEDGNANPMYYAGLSQEMRYMWNHVFPESVYNVWEASADRETQNLTKAIYGQPYVLKEVWAVVDKNLNEVGTYNSKEHMYNSLTTMQQPTTSKKTTKNEEQTEDKKETENVETKEHKNENDIIIGYTNYEPFNYFENGTLTGFDTELARYICEQLGYTPIFKEIEFDSFIMLLNEGKIDCFWNGLLSTDERKNQLSLSNNYIKVATYYDGVRTVEPCAIAFARFDNKVNDFNHALKKANEDGTIQQLIKKYSTDEIRLRNTSKNMVFFKDTQNSVFINSSQIFQAAPKQSSNGSEWYVELTFTEEGRNIFAKESERISKLTNNNNRIGIYINDTLISQPSISEKIDSDTCVVSGNFSKEVANNLANLINQ